LLVAKLVQVDAEVMQRKKYVAYIGCLAKQSYGRQEEEIRFLCCCGGWGSPTVYPR